MANKSNWKGWERIVASVFGWSRNILSGRNNRHDDGVPTLGDVRVPTEFRDKMFIEAKSNRRNAHHTRFHLAQSDDPTKTVFFFTHLLREQYEDSLVTMKIEEFRKMWPLVKHLYSSSPPATKEETDFLGILGETEETPQASDTKRPKRRKASKSKKDNKEATGDVGPDSGI